jgi:hypothetical protein
MKNIFIAVGGSGTKVAEALVRLLAVGFPTHKENGVLTSAGDSLQIWRIDPDRSSGAAVALNNCLKEYAELQKHLSDDNSAPNLASSRWAMEIDTRIRNLDPLQLPRATDNDNEVRTLRGVLDSRYGGKKSSLPLLEPFYEQKDLDVTIDRGFYQKPFIGAAVMAIFADSLGDENSPGGREASLTAFNNNQANFFLCGSLHGGTGACGVPIMGRFLGSRKKANPHWGWRVGASLLAPYCVPPQPPFKALKDGEMIDERMIDALLQRHNDEPAFSALTQDEEKRDLIKQILLGFYAEPEDMEARARQGLSYYKDHSADYFDELYLVGKPEPDKLSVWSNGGNSQSNPLNSAEVVAALAALNFFAMSNAGNPQAYMIGASTGDLDSGKMSLHQLPPYRLGSNSGGDEIDPEKVFLTTSTLHHLLRHQIRWETEAKRWSGIEGLRSLYKDNEAKKIGDQTHYHAATDYLARFMASIVDPRLSIGWSGADAAKLYELWSDDAQIVKDIRAKLAKKFGFGKEAKGQLSLGQSSIKVSTVEFGEWCPPGGQFSRGDYLRYIWSQLFTRSQTFDA